MNKTDVSQTDGYKKEIKEYWTHDSPFYDNYPEHGLTIKDEELWRRFLQTEIGDEPKKILDVGCGTGSIALILASLDHDVSGIDLSEGMLSVCERKANERGLIITTTVGDAEDLPYPDGIFDIVTSRWVLWTLLKPETAISEWKRVLKPGGRILAFDVKTHNANNATITDKLKAKLSGMLISLQDGRKIYRYNKEIYDALPLSYNNVDSFNNQIKLFKDACLSDVSVKPITTLDAMSNEKLDKPWRYHLGWKGYGDWHCISGRKSE